MLSFNAAYERLEPPCSNGYETLVCRYTNGSYRSDQGCPPERAGTRHNGAARAVFERSGRDGGGPYLRRFAVR